MIPQLQNNRDCGDMQVNHRLYCVAVISHSLEHSVYTCSVVLSWFISFRLGMRGLVQVWYIKSAFIILFVGLFYFYNYWAALRAKRNQKIEAASSVLKKDKMADRSGFPSPLPCVVANLLIFEEKRCVILGKNCGKGTKILFLSEVISSVLSPKKQEKLIA